MLEPGPIVVQPIVTEREGPIVVAPIVMKLGRNCGGAWGYCGGATVVEPGPTMVAPI